GYFGTNIDAPMVLGNIPAILETNNSITLSAQKRLNSTVLKWAVRDPAVVKQFILERGAAENLFISLKSLNATEYDYTDGQLLPGINYYRLKIIDVDRKISYSNTVVIINADNGLEIISVTPNPV